MPGDEQRMRSDEPSRVDDVFASGEEAPRELARMQAKEQKEAPEAKPALLEGEESKEQKDQKLEKAKGYIQMFTEFAMKQKALMNELNEVKAGASEKYQPLLEAGAENAVLKGLLDDIDRYDEMLDDIQANLSENYADQLNELGMVEQAKDGFDRLTNAVDQAYQKAGVGSVPTDIRRGAIEGTPTEITDGAPADGIIPDQSIPVRGEGGAAEDLFGDEDEGEEGGYGELMNQAEGLQQQLQSAGSLQGLERVNALNKIGDQAYDLSNRIQEQLVAEQKNPSAREDLIADLKAAEMQSINMGLQARRQYNEAFEALPHDEVQDIDVTSSDDEGEGAETSNATEDLLEELDTNNDDISESDHRQATVVSRKNVPKLKLASEPQSEIAEIPVSQERQALYDLNRELTAASKPEQYFTLYNQVREQLISALPDQKLGRTELRMLEGMLENAKEQLALRAESLDEGQKEQWQQMEKDVEDLKALIAEKEAQKEEVFAEEVRQKEYVQNEAPTVIKEQPKPDEDIFADPALGSDEMKEQALRNLDAAEAAMRAADTAQEEEVTKELTLPEGKDIFAEDPDSEAA